MITQSLLWTPEAMTSQKPALISRFLIYMEPESATGALVCAINAVISPVGAIATMNPGYFHA
jgi:hypothetical protein